MNKARQRRKSGAMRAMVGVVVVALLLAGGLTGAWFYLAGQLDRKIVEVVDSAAGGGTTIVCDGRRVFGYPFRMGLACDGVAVQAPASGIDASAGAFRAVAQIYDPNLIVSELTGPVRVAAPDLPPVQLAYALAQSSTHLSDGRLQRFSLAIDQPVLTLGDGGQPVANSARLELHARQNGEDLDLAFTDAGVTVTPPGLGALPPFDLGLDMAVVGGAEWLRGVLPGGRLQTALRGRSGQLRALRVNLDGGGAAEIAGPFSFSPEGLLSGDFRIALENPQAIAELVGRIVPAAGGVANAIAGGIGFAGRQENGRSVIDVQVRGGRAQLGFIPLGEIPPL